jgi:hypothetical protein
VTKVAIRFENFPRRKRHANEPIETCHSCYAYVHSTQILYAIYYLSDPRPTHATHTDEERAEIASQSKAMY